MSKSKQYTIRYKLFHSKIIPYGDLIPYPVIDRLNSENYSFSIFRLKLATSIIFWSKNRTFFNLCFKRFALLLRSISYQNYDRRWTLLGKNRKKLIKKLNKLQFTICYFGWKSKIWFSWFLNLAPKCFFGHNHENYI